MATTDSIARMLEKFFQILDYQWRLNNGNIFDPMAKDLQEGIDKAIEALYDEPVPSQAEFGGLIVRRSADTQFEVYLKIGVHNDRNAD